MPTALLVTTDMHRVRRWRAALEPLGWTVIVAAEDSSVDLAAAQIDVVLTDGSMPLPPQTAPQECENERPITGPLIVSLGAEIAADVQLHEDPPAECLAVVCKLLATIAAQRRQLHMRSQVIEPAEIDPLTELPNRKAWNRKVGELFMHAERPFFAAILDLDNFKAINEQQGYTAGDRVLREAATVLSSSTRGEDFVARVGGDEFGLLLSVPSVSIACAVLDRLRKQITSALQAKCAQRVTASAAVCSVESTQELGSADKLLDLLYSQVRLAKSAGGNRTVRI